MFKTIKPLLPGIGAFNGEYFISCTVCGHKITEMIFPIFFFGGGGVVGCFFCCCLIINNRFYMKNTSLSGAITKLKVKNIYIFFLIRSFLGALKYTESWVGFRWQVGSLLERMTLTDTIWS